MTRTISILTGTRAEYGLLKPVIDMLLTYPEIRVSLVVTGSHLSPAHGMTVREIEDDGIAIAERIEILLDSDQASGTIKSMGLAMLGFASYFGRYKPDMLLVLGDRYESFCAAAAATVAKIPIAHMHGGELTFGAMDDAFRHAITKMSYLHFAATTEYRDRIIRMGEDPSRVFFVGAVGVENIRSLELLSRNAIFNALGIALESPFAVITYHPATLESADPVSQIRQLFKALGCFPHLRVVFTKANADPGGRAINAEIDDYVAGHAESAWAFSSLGHLRYLSLVRFADIVIGNSSSGIIEAPCFGIPVVNIGTRQKGRVRAANVLDCDMGSESIRAAITKALDPSFRDACRTASNPYEFPGTARKIAETISETIGIGTMPKDFYCPGSEMK